jgi:hypothetical protein
MRTNLLRIAALALMTSAVAFAQTDEAPTDAPAPEHPAATTAPAPRASPAPAPTAAAAPADVPTVSRIDEQRATDAGWDGRWALLFSINNVLQNSSILTPSIMGSVAGAYYLTPTTALRAGFTLGRTTTPAAVTKTVTTTGGTSVTTYAFNPPGLTENDTIQLRSDYLKRMTHAPLAPYFGGGLELGFALQKLNYTDEVSVVGQRTEVANRTYNLSLAARGILGVEWRFHPSFAIFAEYSANLTLFSTNNLSNRTTVENTVGGTTSTSQTTNERTANTWLNLSTGLAQGANFGLEVMF